MIRREREGEGGAKEFHVFENHSQDNQAKNTYNYDVSKFSQVNCSKNEGL